MRALRQIGVTATMAAVNHLPIAIATHLLNHPDVRHFIEDVAAAVPRDVVPEGRLDLLLCSPSCVFFSKARGAKPNSDQKRMDPQAIIRWITELDVTVLICENVQEFRDWGPVNPITEKPIKARKGEYFRAWIAEIRALGYEVEWRILVCADYGDPTTRQRFFMIARKDGNRIVWPRKTHAKHGGLAPDGIRLQHWATAAGLIDFSDRGVSIFNRRPRRKGFKAPKGSILRRALALNTLRRILAGTDRFSEGWKAVFAAAVQEEMDMVRLDEVGLDRPTKRPQLTFEWRRGEAVEIQPEDARVRFQPGDLLHLPVPGEALLTAPVTFATDPYFVMMYGTNTTRATDRPAPTFTAGGNHVALATPSVRAAVSYTCANRSGNAPRRVDAPIAPVLTSPGGGLWLAEGCISPYMLGQQSCSAPRRTTDPIPAVSTAGAISLIVPGVLAAGTSYLIAVNHGDEPSGVNGRRVRDLGEPLQAITRSGGFGLTSPLVRGAGSEPFISVYYGSNIGLDAGAASVHDPLLAITTKARFGVCQPGVTPYLVPQFGERTGQQPRVLGIANPAPAVTSHGAGALVMPRMLVRFDNSGDRSAGVRGVNEPTWTHTGKTGVGFAEYIISPRHSRAGAGPAPRWAGLPLPTVTSGGSQFGVVSPKALTRWTSGRHLFAESEAAANPAPPGRMVWVDGVLIVADLEFRMLRSGPGSWHVVIPSTIRNRRTSSSEASKPG
jgi:DNA (cytosine-5)-methyltransferase 1